MKVFVCFLVKLKFLSKKEMFRNKRFEAKNEFKWKMKLPK